MKPFEYLIVWLPTEEEAKAGKKPTILVEPKVVLASDEKMAMLHAGREVPAELVSDMHQLQVYVRPF